MTCQLYCGKQKRNRNQISASPRSVRRGIMMAEVIASISLTFVILTLTGVILRLHSRELATVRDGMGESANLVRWSQRFRQEVSQSNPIELRSDDVTESLVLILHVKPGEQVRYFAEADQLVRESWSNEGVIARDVLQVEHRSAPEFRLTQSDGVECVDLLWPAVKTVQSQKYVTAGTPIRWRGARRLNLGESDES